MSKQSRTELLNESRKLYASKRTRKAKREFLLELQQLTGYKSIKTIIRHLSWNKKAPRKEKRGRKAFFQSKEVEILKKLWFCMDQPCGKRLKAMLPEWIDPWEKEKSPISIETRCKLLKASSSTLDRALKPYKTSETSRQPDATLTSLKALIPLVDYRRHITETGYLYADTVAHCGTTTKGNFAWTLTLTDDLTQWTSNRAVWNKGQYETCKALGRLINQLPFALKGINTDNGSEFINHHLHNYLKAKHKKALITRSRPMMKNDNARAEEKNRHKVRELVGHERMDHPAYIKQLNKIYRASNLLNNHFNACSRVISKIRKGNKLIRKSDMARTPYARVMEMVKEGRKKEKLEEQHKKLNPIMLRNKVEEGLRELFALKAKLEQEQEGLLAPLTPSAAYDAAPGSNLFSKKTFPRASCEPKLR